VRKVPARHPPERIRGRMRRGSRETLAHGTNSLASAAEENHPRVVTPNRGSAAINPAGIVHQRIRRARNARLTLRAVNRVRPARHRLLLRVRRLSPSIAKGGPQDRRLQSLPLQKLRPRNLLSTNRRANQKRNGCPLLPRTHRFLRSRAWV
jgi:hypothetical protein